MQRLTSVHTPQVLSIARKLTERFAQEHGDALPPDMPAADGEEYGVQATAGDVSKVAKDAAASSGDFEDEDIAFILDTLARRIAKDGSPLSCDARAKFSTAIDRVLRRFNAA